MVLTAKFPTKRIFRILYILKLRPDAVLSVIYGTLIVQVDVKLVICYAV